MFTYCSLYFLHIKLNVIYLKETVRKALIDLFIRLIKHQWTKNIYINCIAQYKPFQRDVQEEQYKYTFGQNFCTIFSHK